jgi:hypothetical protein
VRIGRNEPGAEVRSEVAALEGSALGVVIDARGRPLRLEASQAARQNQLWDWMVALGSEEGALPYDVNAVPEDIAPIPIVPFAALEPLGPAGGGPSTPESELAKLRQTVEEPKRRGLFRRS